MTLDYNTLRRIRDNKPVYTDEYVENGRDYLIATHYIHNEREFLKLINDRSAWQLTNHQHWSKQGLDSLVYNLTKGRARTLAELLAKDGLVK